MALTSHNRHFHHQRSRSTAISLEELLRSISAKLTASRPDQVDSIIEDGLSNVLNLTRAGCVCWYEEEPESDCLKLVLYSTDRLGPEILPSILTRNDLP